MVGSMSQRTNISRIAEHARHQAAGATLRLRSTLLLALVLVLLITNGGAG
jgi:hypothetical protein